MTLAPDQLAALRRQLIRHEALRLTVYDDATGRPIVAGSSVIGHPTIGVGRNLADPGLTEAECLHLLEYDIATRAGALQAALPWFDTLSAVRQRVLIDMSMMGLSKLLKFKNLRAACACGDWPAAAREMLASKWAADVGARAVRLARMMETGEDLT